MGMKQTVDRLEGALKIAERKAEHMDELLDYVRTLARMPEDATLLYAMSGERVSHIIGQSARVLLERVERA